MNILIYSDSECLTIIMNVTERMQAADSSAFLSVGLAEIIQDQADLDHWIDPLLADHPLPPVLHLRIRAEWQDCGGCSRIQSVLMPIACLGPWEVFPMHRNVFSTLQTTAQLNF